MIRKRRAFVALAMCVTALAGCTVEANGAADPTDPAQVEVLTWWASGTEKASLYRLVQEFQAQNQGLRFVDSSVRGPDGVNAREAISARLAADNPPDSFQATAGAGLATFIDAGSLQDLSDLYATSDLIDAFEPELLDLLTRDDRIYAVPSDIRRANDVWVNTALVESSGLDPAEPPLSMDEWIVDLEALRHAGVAYPLALGDEWTQLQLFENVLLSELGPDYAKLWSNAGNWDRVELARAVDTYSRLLSFVDPRGASLTADEAIYRVIGGESAYIVMADVAYQSFHEAGLAYGEQYTSFVTPGTAGMFDLFADTFTLPVGATHQDAARAWLLAVGSAEGQEALTLASGSIPARSDVSSADYPEYQQEAIRDLATATIVPSFAHGVAASAPWTKRISQALTKFRTDQKPDALVNALIAAAAEALA